MAELVARELLHRRDAFLVEKLPVVARAAVEEVIGAHAQPQQVNLLVRLLGLVIDIRNVGRRE